MLMKKYSITNLFIITSFSFYWIIGYALAANTIEVTNRYLYGPGPFPDQTLKTAWIRNLEMDSFLTGIVAGVNNLGEEPNVSGETLQGKTVDGMLSDNTLISESIDMSNAVIMNGQFNLLLAAVLGGPNNGNTYFYSDEDFNWWIKDDIAIDPGFPAGIVRINDFTFTTKPRLIPYSIQTELGYPGGTNQSGSLEAGRIALGYLGDDDADGYIDGMFNAIGRFPLESIFLPGAPFVQLFTFKSDIHISAQESALLSLASARSYVNALSEVVDNDKGHVDIDVIKDNVSIRISKTIFHLKRAISSNDCNECLWINEVIQSLEPKVENTEYPDKSIFDSVFNKMIKERKKENA